MRRSAFLHSIVPLATVITVAACHKSSGFDFPKLTPPVRATLPAGFGGGSNVAAAVVAATAGTGGTLTDISSRFFQNGPTDLFGILQSVDQRMQGLNGVCQSTAAAVPYTITPFGAPVSMFAQCSQTFQGSSGFVQWAVVSSNTGYVYVTVDQTEVAAIIRANTGAAVLASNAQFTVDVWASVGLTNSPWDGQSYGVIQIHADPAASNFEMTVAGMGIGYCGAQIVTDGTNIYAEGSVDYGPTCGVPETACLEGSDATTPSTCSAAEQIFRLPPLGRTSSEGTTQEWGQSQYPATPTLLFNGTTTDAAHFGPSSPSL